MPRTRRIALAHIVQRGHNRKNVFRTEKDRIAYLDALREFREKLELRVSVPDLDLWILRSPKSNSPSPARMLPADCMSWRWRWQRRG